MKDVSQADNRARSIQWRRPWARKRLHIVAACTLASALLTGCGHDGGVAGPSANFDLTILHINDHHSHLEEKSASVQLRDATGEQVEVTVSAGGFPRITSAFAELSRNRENTLKLHAGDAITGTLYFNHAGALGEADAALMNTVCFDAFTLGNHEFDKGDTALAQWLAQLHSGACKTPVLSANVRFAADSALHPSRAPVAVKPYTIVERSGRQIGIVGLTIAEKTKVSSRPDPDTTFENEVTAAQRAIDELHGHGVEKIVMLSHIGYENDKRVLAALSGVDVVIGGDSHTLLGPDTLPAYGVGSPVGPYAGTLTNRDGEPVCVAQAWEYSQIVGELRVSFDEKGRVTACEGTPHVLIGDDFRVDGQPAGRADDAAFRTDIARSGVLRITPADSHASALLQPYKERVEVYKNTVVAHAPIELCSRRVPGGPDTPDYGRSSPECNARGSVSVRGGDIQQLVAHAYLKVADEHYGGADISLQSAGGVRIPLQGTITAENILELLPFDGKLWRLDLTGAEARAMVEEGLDAVLTQMSSGPYPYTGGLRWDVDMQQPAGSRASNFEVYHRPSDSWLPLDDTRMYRLFALSFNATGGDGYTTLAGIPKERRMDVGAQDTDIFLAYIEDQAKGPDGVPVLLPLDSSFYSTKSFRY